MNNWYNKINDYKNPISFSDIYLDKYNNIHNNLLSYALDSFVNYTYTQCNSYIHKYNPKVSAHNDNISTYNAYISSYNINTNNKLSYLSYTTYISYISSPNEYKYSYRWIEKTNINANYWEPSYIYRISRYTKYYENEPLKFTKDLINLKPFWKNEYEINKKSSYIDNNLILFNDNEPHIYEIDYIDYIKEKIRINDKLSDRKKWMKFNHLKIDIQKNPELLKY